MSNGSIENEKYKTYRLIGLNPEAGIVPRTANQSHCKINYCPAVPMIHTGLYLPLPAQYGLICVVI